MLRLAGPEVCRAGSGGWPRGITVFAANDRRFRPRRVGGGDLLGQRFRPARSKVSPRRVGGVLRFRPVGSVGALEDFAP